MRYESFGSICLVTTTSKATTTTCREMRGVVSLLQGGHFSCDNDNKPRARCDEVT